VKAGTKDTSRTCFELGIRDVNGSQCAKISLLGLFGIELHQLVSAMVQPDHGVKKGMTCSFQKDGTGCRFRRQLLAC